MVQLFSNCTTTEKTIPSEFRPKSSPYKHAVLLYGRPSCGNTRFFSRKMQKEEIPFIFHNINAEDRIYRARVNKKMFELVESVNPKINFFGLPVVDVNGKVLISPFWWRFKRELHRLK